MNLVRAAPEWVWTAGGPLLALTLVFVLPHGGDTPPAILSWAVAVYCALTRRFAAIAWFNSPALADATYALTVISGLAFSVFVVLKPLHVIG